MSLPMPCPTCGHTLINVSQHDNVFWCPRCGTLCAQGERQNPGTPALVARVRSLQALYPVDGYFNTACARLGIDEATALPGARGPSVRNQNTRSEGLADV